MTAMSKSTTRFLSATAAVTALLFAGCATMAPSQQVGVTLSGDQQVPPVKTSGSGSGTITVNDDKTVSGSVTTTGVKGTAAHIHVGAAGKTGPVAVPLTKSGDNTWSVAAGAKLTDEQYAAFKNGELYVNVHTAENKAGEVRGQLKP